MPRYVLLTLMLIFSAAPCWADVLENFDITAKIQEKYASIKSFSADIAQTLTHAESRTSEHRTGTLAFKKPGLIHIETSVLEDGEAVDTSRIIVNPDSVWMYVPDEQIAYKYSRNMLRDVSPSLLVLTGQANLLENFSIDGQAEEGALTKLTLYPNEPTTQMVKVVIWVETQTGTLQRVQITDFYENINDIAFTKLQFDGNVKDSLFQFTPPRGVSVEDHTRE